MKNEKTDGVRHIIRRPARPRRFGQVYNEAGFLAILAERDKRWPVASKLKITVMEGRNWSSANKYCLAEKFPVPFLG